MDALATVLNETLPLRFDFALYVTSLQMSLGDNDHLPSVTLPTSHRRATYEDFPVFHS